MRDVHRMPATETRVHEHSKRITVEHTIVFGNMIVEYSPFDEFSLLWCYVMFKVIFCVCFFVAVCSKVY